MSDYKLEPALGGRRITTTQGPNLEARISTLESENARLREALFVRSGYASEAPIKTSLHIDGENGEVFVYARADYENPSRGSTICVTLRSSAEVDRLISELRAALKNTQPVEKRDGRIKTGQVFEPAPREPRISVTPRVVEKDSCDHIKTTLEAWNGAKLCAHCILLREIAKARAEGWRAMRACISPDFAIDAVRQARAEGERIGREKGLREAAGIAAGQKWSRYDDESPAAWITATADKIAKAILARLPPKETP